MAAKLKADRTHWISLLETIAKKPTDEADSEWKWLMTELKLPNEYYFVVSKVIAQGRWRKSNNPRGYLKACAKREYFKAKPVQNLVVLKSASFDKLLDTRSFAADSPTTLQSNDRVWRTVGERYYDDDGEVLPNLRERLLAHLPGELTKVHMPSKRTLSLNSKCVYIRLEPQRFEINEFDITM